MLDILNKTKEQCEDCIKAMKTLSAEDYWPKNKNKKTKQKNIYILNERAHE